MKAFTCHECGASFTLGQAALEQYPGWTPKHCPSCHSRERGRHRQARSAALLDDTSLLSLEEILATYEAGPTTGVFTDGSAVPNPGPGGWGAVYVVEDEIIAQQHGHEPDTTNNRMELAAIRAGIELVPKGTAVTIYTDSNLAYRTFTEWAAGWEARGWKRKTGPIKNLDLVQEIYHCLAERPELRLEWVPGHAGYRWNEYADALASVWLRDRP
jgi:ribonuclease HI